MISMPSVAPVPVRLPRPPALLTKTRVAPPLPSALAYYLIHRPDTVRDPEMGIFKQWLLEQAAATQNKSPPSGGLET